MRRPLLPLLALLLAALLAAACGGAPGPFSRDADDSFDDDVRDARALSEEFWKQEFSRYGRTYRPITAFIPYTGKAGPSCGGQKAVPGNAFYCPLGHFVAYDRAWMESLWSEMGDGSVYVIIPHELGHAVQAQLRTGFELNVQMELQADCYAGGTLAALVGSGALQAQPGDEDELLLSLESAGDPTDDWLNPSAHGTAAQRQQAFARGYGGGVGAC